VRDILTPAARNRQISQVSLAAKMAKHAARHRQFSVPCFLAAPQSKSRCQGKTGRDVHRGPVCAIDVRDCLVDCARSFAVGDFREHVCRLLLGRKTIKRGGARFRFTRVRGSRTKRRAATSDKRLIQDLAPASEAGDILQKPLLPIPLSWREFSSPARRRPAESRKSLLLTFPALHRSRGLYPCGLFSLPHALRDRSRF
jgi:hypothetical protein